jgi:excisionase family DNA binding protein
MNAQEPILCSIADAARLLGLGLTKTNELVVSRELVSHKIGSRRLVRLDSIKALIERTAA